MAHLRSAQKEQIKNLTTLRFSLNERFYIISKHEYESVRVSLLSLLSS